MPDRGADTDAALSIGGLLQMAKKQRPEQRAEHRWQHDEEERQRRVMVITEFDAGDPEATMHAMATALV